MLDTRAPAMYGKNWVSRYIGVQYPVVARNVLFGNRLNRYTPASSRGVCVNAIVRNAIMQVHGQEPETGSGCLTGLVFSGESLVSYR